MLSWCEHSAYWRDTDAFTGHGSQRILGIFEPYAAAGQAFERVSTGYQSH
jgi:hypothetical protein